MSKTIKFNAGRVQYDDETKKCTPLPHKGVVTVSPSADDDGFFDFVWTPKTDTNVEKDELLLIPGDMTFKRVALCKTGRVVALTFLSSGDKSLYWLQDLGDDEELNQWTAKDEELVENVQKLITPVEDADEAEQPAIQEEPFPLFHESDTYPILLLSDVLREELVSDHLFSLLPEELRITYGHLPPGGVEPTAENILELVRSQYYARAVAELSSNISENGVGQFLAMSYEYEYTGEGKERKSGSGEE